MEFQSLSGRPGGISTISRIPFKLMSSDHHLILVLQSDDDVSLVYMLDQTKATFVPAAGQEGHPYIQFPHLNILIYRGEKDSDHETHVWEEGGGFSEFFHTVNETWKDLPNQAKHSSSPSPRPVHINQNDILISNQVYRIKCPNVQLEVKDLEAFKSQMVQHQRDITNLCRSIGMCRAGRRMRLVQDLIDARRKWEIGMGSLTNGAIRKAVDDKVLFTISEPKVLNID